MNGEMSMSFEEKKVSSLKKNSSPLQMIREDPKEAHRVSPDNSGLIVP